MFTRLLARLLPSDLTSLGELGGLGGQEQQWRSSPIFIIAAIGMALFTDSFLHTSIVPILPYISETRLGLDSAYTQELSLSLLSQGAFISVVLNPIIKRFARKRGTKRTWMLWAYIVALLGTAILAVAPVVSVLFAGRFFQAVASSVMCVVGYWTIEDNVKPEYLGKIYRIMSVAVSLGTAAGPLLTGVLFDFGGYWSIWLSVLVVIMVDVILRSLMLDRAKETDAKDDGEIEANEDDNDDDGENGGNNGNVDFSLTSIVETTPLLATRDRIRSIFTKDGLGFYLTLLQHRRFACGIVSCIVFSLLVSTFDTTLPLHIRDEFGWGSLQTGLLFAALQSPAAFLGPLCEWMKERIGSRHPVAIGFLTLAPLMWLLGVPGDERFPWANEGVRGPVIYAATVALIGVTISTLNGAGTMEATSAVDEIQSEQPGVFGPSGGYARALSMSSVAWTLGKFLGPIVSGFLSQGAGYYDMCSAFALMCVAASVNAFINMGA